jgi:predicted nucleic acid-binding protein
VSLVLDPSITLSWYFEDECSPAADALLHRVAEDGAVVPSLWRLEIANGLQIALRRRRINRTFRDRSLAELGRMAITTDLDTDRYTWTNTLQIADRFQLTVYDAAYLELAQRRSLPLATLDKPLRAAAGTLGITLFDAAA